MQTHKHTFLLAVALTSRLGLLTATRQHKLDTTCPFTTMKQSGYLSAFRTLHQATCTHYWDACSAACWFLFI